jgi:hypothetical protein
MRTRRRGGWRALSNGCGLPPARFWPATASTRRAARRRPRHCSARTSAGFVVTDRYAGYHFLDVLQQPLCWSHVIRQLVEVSQRPGETGRRGTQLVALARQVIATHRAYMQAGHDPDWLAASSSRCASRSARCSSSAPLAATPAPRTSPPARWMSTIQSAHRGAEQQSAARRHPDARRGNHVRERRPRELRATPPNSGSRDA